MNIDKGLCCLYTRPRMDAHDQAIEAIGAPGNLSRFAERGFRTLDKDRVLGSLTRAGLDPDTALEAARSAVESVGGFVTSAERNPGLAGGRSAWRYVYEIWMVPEDVSATRAA